MLNKDTATCRRGRVKLSWDEEDAAHDELVLPNALLNNRLPVVELNTACGGGGGK
jgi:hypothetical protein